MSKDNAKVVPRFTEMEIIKHLTGRIDNKKFPFQAPNIFIYKWECDYWAMDANGITREFEIKVSRADYLKDAEKEKHNKDAGANFFYYVCPRWLIDPSEVDKRYGLLFVYEGGFIEFVKKPIRLHDRKFEDWQMLANKFYWRFRQLWKEKWVDKQISTPEPFEGLCLDNLENENA